MYKKNLRRKGLLLIIFGGPIIVISGLWTAYWCGVSHILRDSVRERITELNQHGVEFNYGNLNVYGYPFWFEIRLENPSVMLKRNKNWKWRLPIVVAKLRPWQRSKILLDLSGKHKFNGSRNFGVFARKLGAVVHVGKQGILSTSFDAEGIKAKISEMRVLSVEKVTLKLNSTRDNGVQCAYTLCIHFKMNSLKVPAAWAFPLGNVVSNFRLSAHLEGTVNPLNDLDGMTLWRESGGVLELNTLDISHAALKVYGNGTFALDPDLQPIGSLALRLKGGLEAADSLIRRKLINKRQAMAIKLMLAALTTREAGQAAHIKLPLTLQDRELTVGSFSLFKVPRIDWSKIFKELK